jgi:NADPH-dependent curcumin reductase CurA
MEKQIKRFVLLKRPNGMPDESDFGLEKTALPALLKENELRLLGVYYSVDPYMRGRMNDGKSYISPFALKQPIVGAVVARVMESRSPDFKPDDLVVGQLPWSTEIIIASKEVHNIDANKAFATDYLGVLGMTGMTAYFGLLDIGRPKAGETVVISGAAGAVGCTAGQIAKIKECRVVGIVGTEEKAKLLKGHFKFDDALNYKTSSNLSEEIKSACPRGVDIYFDNVGGPISDAVLENMNPHGRVILCGQISLYNSPNAPQGPRPTPLLLSRSISMEGFIVSNFKARFPEAISVLSKWLDDGKIEASETIVQGFENLPKALIGLFSGANTGKMLVRAAA